MSCHRRSLRPSVSGGSTGNDLCLGELKLTLLVENGDVSTCQVDCVCGTETRDCKKPPWSVGARCDDCGGCGQRGPRHDAMGYDWYLRPPPTTMTLGAMVAVCEVLLPEMLRGTVHKKSKSTRGCRGEEGGRWMRRQEAGRRENGTRRGGRERTALDDCGGV